ncbi:MAG: thiamine biosynthesis ThiH [Bacillota bacterium]|nr:MAG: thiamine biosynthesis ThiH [Bacillota bacterium]MBS3950487.1 [FeFe] hydrogenase H-cluster radical SAM maturase HydG [Peptococcaceae bacterium]
MEFYNIERLLGCVADGVKVKDILDKAEQCVGLTVEEAAALLLLPGEWNEGIFASARKVKQALYGPRVVLFAPLYISNLCTNSCLYCSFRQENKQLTRRKLTQDEIAEQTRLLIAMGHKRVLLETGEDLTQTPIEYVLESIHTIYSIRHIGNGIRRVNVNIAATSTDNYQKLRAAGIGTYQLFQETYHQPTYEFMHPSGPKADFNYHLTAMERAINGGVDDFGLGALLGLYDYRFEVLSLIAHAQYLKKTHGIGPHTVSVPRLRPARNTRYPENHLVDDNSFARIVAILRLALPYTGIILSTREAPLMREFLLDVGVSQMSAASATSPGGYGKSDENTQFEGIDHRSLDEVVGSIISKGYVPSFCTGCYRKQRTGARFMDLVEHGHIKELCQSNALLTLAEYLEQYGSSDTRTAASLQWDGWIGQIPEGTLRESTRARLQRVFSGERDVYV